MSQRDRFAGGFLLGTIVGGIIGGVVGAVVTSRLDQGDDENKPSFLKSGKGGKLSTEESIEMARHRLEDKIAQLNHAIDDVRQQLSPENGNSAEQEISSESN